MLDLQCIESITLLTAHIIHGLLSIVDLSFIDASHDAIPYTCHKLNINFINRHNSKMS